MISFQKMISTLGILPHQALLIIALGLLYAGFEGVAVGMLFPVLQYVERGESIFETENRTDLIQSIFDVVSALGLSLSFPILLICAFVPIFSRQFLRYCSQIYSGKIRFEAIGRIRREGFSAFVNAKTPFLVTEGQGRIVNSLTTEVERGVSALPIFLQFYEGAILLLVYLGLLAILATWLVPIILVLMGIVILAIRTKIHKTQEFGIHVSQSNEALHLSLSEKVAGIRLLKIMGQEGKEIAVVSEIIQGMTQSFIKICRIKEGLEASIEPLMLLGTLFALYVAVTVFGMDLASLGIFMFILLRINPLLKQVNVARQSINALMASLDNIYSVINNAKANCDFIGGSEVFKGINQEIAFSKVNFFYPGQSAKLVLRDVSIKIYPNQLTAIVGKSGVGKSTLLDLIPRLHDVTGGSISFDGIPIQRFDVNRLRASIGIVDQHGFLFHDTVENNISYGIKNTSHENIVKAAKDAFAHEFIEKMSNGYQTLIGERGAKLSEGQRQRMNLARVLLQDPEILLLDEPTSALDSESEKYVQAVIESLRKKKVIIVVAHRFSTIKLADQIIVLAGGEVAEIGTHDSLYDKDGVYRQLFDLQMHV